jgi:hypothetical protein
MVSVWSFLLALPPSWIIEYLLRYQINTSSKRYPSSSEMSRVQPVGQTMAELQTQVYRKLLVRNKIHALGRYLAYIVTLGAAAASVYLLYEMDLRQSEGFYYLMLYQLAYSLGVHEILATAAQIVLIIRLGVRSPGPTTCTRKLMRRLVLREVLEAFQ